MASNRVPLSVTQEQLWILDRLAPDSPFYNTVVMGRLDGALDPEALNAAFRGVMARQEMLRSSVGDSGGEPFQEIHAEVGLPLERTDLTDLDPDERQAEADRIVDAEVHRPFDLTSPPLFRLQLIRLADQEHLLLLVVHHIVCDGWSVQVMFQEVGDLYSGFVAEQPVELPPLRAQFAQYAQEQRRQLAGPRRDALVSYWKRQLAGAPGTLELRTDRPRPAEASYRGDRHLFPVPDELYEKLKEFSRKSRASLFMTCLAGFDVLLARASGQYDILVGTPVGNRDRAEWGPVVGYFADTLVMRARLEDDPTFQELLNRVRTTTLQGFVHRGLPFRSLVEELTPERRPDRNPFFQVMFILQNIPPRPRQTELPGLTMTRLDDVRKTSIFDLRLDLFEFGGALHAQLEYSTDLFDRSTAERLADQYVQLLADVCAHPDRRVSALSLAAAGSAAGFNDDLEGA
ncbi:MULTISPECIES: condensation domain-containing protein [unclassified Streptomyces]|uniref:condensation domain-containing protein n=1 Tax=unclassified Streptomyces TaxID=2593676 RepID=UPI000AED0F4B|nr:condensation domain-containing protein [Streptomyces sp. CB02058]